MSIGNYLSKKVLRRFLFGLITLAFSLALIEATLRLILPLSVPHILKLQPAQFTATPEEMEIAKYIYNLNLGWIIHSATKFGERPGQKEFAENFAMLFGDSFVFGDEVADSETWAFQLSLLLQKNIYNFGVGAYGTDQALLLFREKVGLLRTRYAVLGVTSENINRIMNTYRKFYFVQSRMALTKPYFRNTDHGIELFPNPIKSPDDLALLTSTNYILDLGEKDFWFQQRRKHFFSLRNPYLLNLVRPSFWQQLANSRSEGEMTGPVDVNLWEVEEAVSLMAHIMVQFSVEAKTAGMRPLIVIIPSRQEVFSAEDLESSNAPSPQQICLSHKLLCFDGRADMSKRLREVGAGDFSEYWLPSGHLSVKGNRLLAEGLAEFFMSDK